MNQPLQPTDVISPAEAKFWQEKADHAPAMLRTQVKQLSKVETDYMMMSAGSVALGGALGIAAFTKYIKGNWKYAAGIGSTLALGLGFACANAASYIKKGDAPSMAYADALEKNPELRAQLANFLSKSVTADLIQEVGIEGAVLVTTDFCTSLAARQQMAALNPSSHAITRR